MSHSRWNWLNSLRHGLKTSFSKLPPPSKSTRRQSLYHRAGPVEALEHRLVLTISVMGSMVFESIGTLAFTYQGDGMNADPHNLNYATSDDSAVSPGDFTAVTGSVTIAPLRHGIPFGFRFDHQ